MNKVKIWEIKQLVQNHTVSGGAYPGHSLASGVRITSALGSLYHSWVLGAQGGIFPASPGKDGTESLLSGTALACKGDFYL